MYTCGISKHADINGPPNLSTQSTFGVKPGVRGDFHGGVCIYAIARLQSPLIAVVVLSYQKEFRVGSMNKGCSVCFWRERQQHVSDERIIVGVLTL